MKAMVYQGDGKIELKDKPKPELKDPTDAIIKGMFSSVCCTDHSKTNLHPGENLFPNNINHTRFAYSALNNQS